MPLERSATDDPATLVGRKLGDFQILRQLGRGGMGEVYLAEQKSLGRRVALKVLRPDLATDQSYIRRFEAEARAVAPIHHPNIVSVIAIGEDEGVRYIVLEYVHGITLHEYVRRKGPLPIAIVRNLLSKVGQALQRAGEEGIVHRDIKPENVLLTRKGEVKVADFGLARRIEEDVSITGSGVAIGTPLYMSPEQIQAKPVDHRSDLYSLGVMAYFMLAGRPPFAGETAMSLAVQHLRGDATPVSTVRPDVPRSLSRIVERLMKIDPDDRYPSAREFLRELTAVPVRPIADDSMTEAIEPADAGWFSGIESTVSMVAASVKAPRRQRWLLPASLLAALLVGAGVGWSRRPNDASLVALGSWNRPNTAGVRELDEGWLQLTYARWADDEQERERRLWAVLENHPGDEVSTVEAAVDLAQRYLRSGPPEASGILADYLVERDDHSQRLLGHLLRAIVESRAGRFESSDAAMLAMLGESGQARLPRDQLRWVAIQYLLTVRRNSGADVDVSDAATRGFRERFAMSSL